MAKRERYARGIGVILRASVGLTARVGELAATGQSRDADPRADAERHDPEPSNDEAGHGAVLGRGRFGRRRAARRWGGRSERRESERDAERPSLCGRDLTRQETPAVPNQDHFVNTGIDVDEMREVHARSVYLHRVLPLGAADRDVDDARFGQGEVFVECLLRGSLELRTRPQDRAISVASAAIASELEPQIRDVEQRRWLLIIGE